MLFAVESCSSESLSLNLGSACWAVQSNKVGLTSIPLTDAIEKQTEWTPRVLEERQRELLQHAKQCWRLY